MAQMTHARSYGLESLDLLSTVLAKDDSGTPVCELRLDTQCMSLPTDFVHRYGAALSRAHAAMLALESGAIANPDENGWSVTTGCVIHRGRRIRTSPKRSKTAENELCRLQMRSIAAKWFLRRDSAFVSSCSLELADRRSGTSLWRRLRDGGQAASVFFRQHRSGWI